MPILRRIIDGETQSFFVPKTCIVPSALRKFLVDVGDIVTVGVGFEGGAGIKTDLIKLRVKSVDGDTFEGVVSERPRDAAIHGIDYRSRIICKLANILAITCLEPELNEYPPGKLHTVSREDFEKLALRTLHYRAAVVLELPLIGKLEIHRSTNRVSVAMRWDTPANGSGDRTAAKLHLGAMKSAARRIIQLGGPLKRVEEVENESALILFMEFHSMLRPEKLLDAIEDAFHQVKDEAGRLLT